MADAALHGQAKRLPTRVLVVEDEAIVRRLLLTILRVEGFEVACVADASGALQLLDERGIPELLITDINLPGSSGVELLTTVRQRWGLLPVILISAGGSVSTAELAAHGCAWFLAKPFGVGELLRLIETALQDGPSAPPASADV
jgi:two-component system, NtrC family, nitrogen regulation response regulator GlnG